MYRIDKNVPMNNIKPVANRYNEKYPFRKMEVGDSFVLVIPEGCEVWEEAAIYRNVSHAARHWEKRHKIYSRVVKLVEDEKRVVRVWRIG